MLAPFLGEGCFGGAALPGGGGGGECMEESWAFSSI